MAVIFSENSGSNNDFWKPEGQVLTAVIKDADNEKGEYDKFVSAIFNERNSKKYAEKTAGLTSLGNMTLTPEGEAAPIDSISEAEPKLIVHNAFQNGFAVTRQMKDDGMIDDMKTAAQNLVLSYKRTRAQLASDALTNGASSFVFSGKTLDSTTGDGQALFSTSHAGGQSNVFTDAFGTTSEVLNKLANVGRNFKNASGQVQGFTFDTIIIPSNCPELEDTIKKIIRTDLMVGSNYNDINTQKGLWNLVIDPCWQAPASRAKDPYIIMSSEANKSLLAAMFYDRVVLDVQNWVDKSTRNLCWTGYARMSAGFRDFRAFILGGATAGSSL